MERGSPPGGFQLPSMIDGLTRTALAHSGEQVIRSLKSGKEATVYLLLLGDTHVLCATCASAAFRSEHGTGAAASCAAVARRVPWRRATGSVAGSQRTNAEVAALYKLVAACVRVPKPYGYFNDNVDRTKSPARFSPDERFVPLSMSHSLCARRQAGSPHAPVKNCGRLGYRTRDLPDCGRSRCVYEGGCWFRTVTVEST